MTYSKFTSLLNSLKPKRMKFSKIVSLGFLVFVLTFLSMLGVPAAQPAAAAIADSAECPHLNYCYLVFEEAKETCQYRHEDGGTPYSSCYCQGKRAQANCVAERGCALNEWFLMEINPECFGIQ